MAKDDDKRTENPIGEEPVSREDALQKETLLEQEQDNAVSQTKETVGEASNQPQSVKDSVAIEEAEDTTAENEGQEPPSKTVADTEESTSAAVDPSTASTNPEGTTPPAQGQHPSTVEAAATDNASTTDESPDTHSKKKGFTLPSPKVLVLGAVALVLLIAAIVIGVTASEKSKLDNPVHSVLISVYDDEEFETKGTFSLTGLEFFSKEYIENNLYFDPDVKFSVTKDGKEYVITFEDYQNISYLGYFPYYNLEGKENVEVFRVNYSNLTVSLGNYDVFVDSPITLVFSEQVDVRSLEENLTISPSTKFTMMYDLNTVTIYPETTWDTTAKYTVSIGAGYTSTSGKRFNSEQVLKFHIVRYDEDGNIILYYPEIDFKNDDSFIITKDVNMLLTFNGDLLTEPVPVTIETYRLGDVEKFKTQGLVYLDYEVDLSRIEKIGTDAFLIKDGKNQFEIKNPGEGAYVLSVKYNDPYENTEIEVRTSYLVTPYSMYLQSSRNETLAWVHKSDLNGDSGGPASGFTVVFNEDSENKIVTDEKGIAILPNLQEVADKTAKEVDDDYSPYYYYSDRRTEIVDVSVYDTDGKLVYYDNAKLRLNALERRDSFYSYLFTDRTIYRPNDTIKIWGFIRAFRTNDNPMPKTVTAIFDPEGLNMEVVCTVDAHGAFTGEIVLDQIRSTQYSLQTVVTYPADPNIEGSKEVTMSLNTEYLTVKDFQKPSYVIKSTTDKDFYQKGDTVNVTVAPTFYDGTPLPEFPLEVYTREGDSGEWKRLDDLTTNAEGIATFSFPVPDAPDDEYYRNYLGANSNFFRVQISSDGQQITNLNDYTCFYPETMVETIVEKQADGKNLMMTVNTYKIDLTKPSFLNSIKELEGMDWKIFSEENLLKNAKGAPTDMTVNLGLRWRYKDTKGIIHQNRRRSLSEGYYSFDNWYGFDYSYVPPEDLKVVDTWETQEKNISLTTKNGKAIVSNLIFMPAGTEINISELHYLRSFVTYTDDESDYDTYSYYPKDAFRYNWLYDDSDGEKPKGFTYQVTDTVTNEDLTPESFYYRSSLVAAGNKTNFKLLYDGEEITRHGTILYSTIQNGLYEYHVVDANEFDFTYVSEYGPELTLLGAYFDGYRVHYIEDIGLRVNTETLNLNIDVTSDKTAYSPGDSVTLEINTTDIKGNGVPGNLCVAVVDEAVFAVSEQYLNVFYDLFDNFWYLDNYVTKYCTTYRAGGANYELWSGGKGEGEGGEFYDSYRKNFKDTASFIPARTDENGKATVTFTLPDNVTSWRITTVEIGDDLTTGTGKTNIISTMPFFTQPVVSSKYIEGDEISMLVQGHGVSLTADSEIDYTITLTGDGFNKTLTTKGKAYQPWEFNFGVLPMGTYTLAAKSQFGGYSDTVELPVHVIKSNLELVVNTPIDVKLNQQLDISALRYPVSLTIYDKENAAFYNSISSLFGHYCMAPSQRIPRFVAKQVLRDTLGADEEIPYYIAKGNDSVADMQQPDGGIGPYANTTSELMLSMYMSLISGNQFNQQTLADYFRTQIEALKKPSGSTSDDTILHNKQKNIAAAYLGLAAIGQVEKAEIYELLGLDDKGKTVSASPLRQDSKAYYIAALAYLGDDKVAKELYESQLQSIIGEIPSTTIYKSYYKYTASELDWERDLSAIWIAASKINQGDSIKVAEYHNQFYWRYRSLFEGMIFTLNYKMVHNNLTFAYTLDGKNVADKVGFTGATTLVLNKSQVENLRFTKLEPGVTVKAYYVGEPAELDIAPSDDLSVVKTVTNLDSNTYRIDIKLTFAKDAPKGDYDISDWIPSNSRLYNRGGSHDYDYYFNTEGQKIYFTYNRDTTSANTKIFTYTVRQTYRASAMLDTVYVIHGESGINATSEKAMFVPANTNLTTPMVHIDPSKNVAPR